MIAGTTLNTFNNHCDRVKMANLAQIVNVLQAVILTPGGDLVTVFRVDVLNVMGPSMIAAGRRSRTSPGSAKRPRAGFG